MSRIVGWVGQGRDPSAPDGIVADMLDTFSSSKRAIKHTAGTAFGWTGHDSGGRGSVGLAGDVIVAFDGSILNSTQLSRELRVPGRHTDIIAALYEARGFPEAMKCLHGDYAVALYDATSGACWLGRDRLGVKPLYYLHNSGGLAFASQPRALLALAEGPLELNAGFVARFAGSHYRTFDNLPGESPYAGIHQLPAASVICHGAAGFEGPESYWMLVETGDWPANEDELAEQYRELLMNAVTRRLRTSASPAFTLSGGLDSSSVLCCAAASTERRVHAFSSVYTDPSFDERNEIQDVIDEKDVLWEQVELPDQIDILSIIDRLIRIHDEPVATATWLSHLMLCDRVAGGGFDAVFGGLGGDELNAGEYEYFPMYFADIREAGDEAKLNREIEAWAMHHDHPIHKKNPQVAMDLMNRLSDADAPGRCLPDNTRLLRYAHVVHPEYYELAGFVPEMDTPFHSYLKNRTFQDMFRETLPCCLRAEDRQCTAAGISHFDPFLDHEVVEFMYRVPGAMKIRDGVTKQLLRSAMRGILPEVTRTRIAKTGWNAPAHRWFSGPSLDSIRDLIASRRFLERGIYDQQAVVRIVDDHNRIVESGVNEENHMMFLWQLVNLELWIRSLEGGSRGELS